jgi:hypothetical protein
MLLSKPGDIIQTGNEISLSKRNARVKTERADPPQSHGKYDYIFF